MARTKGGGGRKVGANKRSANATVTVGGQTPAVAMPNGTKQLVDVRETPDAAPPPPPPPLRNDRLAQQRPPPPPGTGKLRRSWRYLVSSADSCGVKFGARGPQFDTRTKLEAHNEMTRVQLKAF